MLKPIVVAQDKEKGIKKTSFQRGRQQERKERIKQTTQLTRSINKFLCNTNYFLCKLIYNQKAWNEWLNKKQNYVLPTKKTYFRFKGTCRLNGKV